MNNITLKVDANGRPYFASSDLVGLAVLPVTRKNFCTICGLALLSGNLALANETFARAMRLRKARPMRARDLAARAFHLAKEGKRAKGALMAYKGAYRAACWKHCSQIARDMTGCSNLRTVAVWPPDSEGSAARPADESFDRCQTGAEVHTYFEPTSAAGQTVNHKATVWRIPVGAFTPWMEQADGSWRRFRRDANAPDEVREAVKSPKLTASQADKERQHARLAAHAITFIGGATMGQLEALVAKDSTWPDARDSDENPVGVSNESRELAIRELMRREAVIASVEDATMDDPEPYSSLVHRVGAHIARRARERSCDRL